MVIYIHAKKLYTRQVKTNYFVRVKEFLFLTTRFPFEKIKSNHLNEFMYETRRVTVENQLLAPFLVQ